MGFISGMVLLRKTRNPPDKTAKDMFIFGFSSGNFDEGLFGVLDCAHNPVFEVLKDKVRS